MKRSPDDDEISMPAGTRQRKGGSERRSGATGEALVADSPAQDPRTDFADSDASTVIDLTGLAASRTGFIAGFSYYEFSRIGGDQALRFPLYPQALYTAFALSVVCGGAAALVRIYLRPNVVTRNGNRGGPATFMGGTGSIVYMCFVFAFVCYTAGVSMMENSFNPLPADRKGTADELCRWVARVPFYIVLALQCVFERLLASWSHEIRGSALSPTTVLSATSAQALQRVNGTASRTGLMIGVLGHALARWQASSYSDGLHGQLSSLYHICASWAAASLILAVFLSTLFGLHARMLPEGHQRETFAARSSWVAPCCHALFVVGSVLTLLAGALMGYGCSPTVGGPSVPGQACYALVAYVPAITCGAALLLVLSFWTRMRGATSWLAPAAPSVDGSAEDLSPLLSIADSAVTCGSFLPYNVATFDTDVIRAPCLDSVINFGLTSEAQLFLWANWLTVASAMAVNLAMAMLEAQLLRMPSLRTKRELAEALGRPMLRVAGVSVAGLLLSVSLLCICKSRVLRWEPALIIVVAFAAVSRGVAQHAKVDGDSFEPETHEDTRVSPALARLSSQAFACSQQVMILGFFAYNAISFHFRPDAAFGPVYALLMALCFSAAVVVFLFSAVMSSTAPIRGETTQFLARWVIRGSGLVFIFFLAAFSCMGYVKQWTFMPSDEAHQSELSEKFGVLQLTTSAISFVVIAAATLHIRGLETSAISAGQPQRSDEPMESELIGDIQALASATSFPVGNVFYEILFAAVNERYPLATWCYFGLAMVSFGVGGSAIVVAALLSRVSAGLPTPEARAQFCAVAGSYRRGLAAAYVISFSAWLAHFGFSACVKVPSLAWATSALCAATAAALVRVLLLLSQHKRVDVKPSRLRE